MMLLKHHKWNVFSNILLTFRKNVFKMFVNQTIKTFCN